MVSELIYFQDELGSPIRLAGADNHSLETYGYDEFGQNLYHNQGKTQPFGYTGYQADDIAGTYYAQAREYMPSAGRFVSRDADRFISINNIHSINLYQYCMSSPMRYSDPSGNDLEDRYPLTRNENGAVQINVSGNDIMIDVYVDFKGDENLTTDNGTPCKDLAIAGIENWSGNYLDVFGEDVTVSVNVHEGNRVFWNPQKYVRLYLEKENMTPHEKPSGKDWGNSINREIHISRWDPRNPSPYSDEKYVRTVTHEMGHVFGIDNGYKDTDVGCPDAYELGLIDKNDVMKYQLDKLNISNTDIGMLILAYWEDAWQSFADYPGHRQSQYFQQEGKE